MKKLSTTHAFNRDLYPDLVYARRGEGNYEVIGEGDVAAVLDMLVANLPANCGPAVTGTLEDLIDETNGRKI